MAREAAGHRFVAGAPTSDVCVFLTQPGYIYAHEEDTAAETYPWHQLNRTGRGIDGYGLPGLPGAVWVLSEVVSYSHLSCLYVCLLGDGCYSMPPKGLVIMSRGRLSWEARIRSSAAPRTQKRIRNPF